jgi:hypothetical protein
LELVLRQPHVLSTRAYNVLDRIVNADHAQKSGKTLELGSLSVKEVLRRAARIDSPPLTYHALLARFHHCGKKTAREIALALGLPLPPRDLAQCPRCGHVFGGGDLHE